MSSQQQPSFQPSFLASPTASRDKHSRRSLRERLRDGISIGGGGGGQGQSSTTTPPTKSKSIDSSSYSTQSQLPPSLTSQLTHATSQLTSSALDFIQSPFTSTPTPCTNYTVLPGDTINSIAVKHGITASELVKLNKLAGGGRAVLVVGQGLRVPRGEQGGGEKQQHGGGVKSTGGSGGDDDGGLRDKKFIKLGVRHISDGKGVISGTLLVTPNAVMFDPNVSDPLVIDQGAELFGIILPIEVVAAAGIYNDIVGMRIGGRPTTTGGGEEVLLWTGGGGEERGGGSCSEEVFDDQPPPPGPPPPTPTISTTTTPSQQIPPPPTRQRSSTCSSSPPPPTNLQPTPTSSLDSVKSKVLKRLSFPLTWGTAPSGDDEQPTSTKNKFHSLVSFDDFGGELRSSFEKLLPQQHSKSITMPTPPPQPPPPLNTTPPQPHLSSQPQQNWFLCLTTGHSPLNLPKPGHMVSYGQKNYVKSEYWFGLGSERDVEELYRFWMLWWPYSYGRVEGGEPLPHLSSYTLTDESQPFNFNPPPPTNEPDEEKLAEQLNDLTKESWEMIKAPYTKLYSFINKHKELRSTGSSSTTSTELFLDEWNEFFESQQSCDYDGSREKVVSLSDELTSLNLLLSSSTTSSDNYELLHSSEILTDLDIRNLGSNLTARAQGYPWSMIFSTTKHGFSLATMYRKMDEEVGGEECPVLVVVEDTGGNVFGSLLSQPPHVSDHFYGTGQSFLFTLRQRKGDQVENDFQVFKWTGENNYFMKGNVDCLSIGAGDGHFAIWLDSDLYIGHTDTCTTFNNPSLVGGQANDFIVKILEIWSFSEKKL